ncbi:hypothetical protein NPIL_295851 [Nephila pilipes]|uniref:Uncharacterized protein n=1 Tax=Nephila pilipes TaxID=299642 RepID=A0A8X6J034_NEPPI|nr:hypothetical protein NPIL_295851 [Nephila pilipes]
MEITVFAHQKKLKLVDPYEDVRELPIDTLIGADFYLTAMIAEPSEKHYINFLFLHWSEPNLFLLSASLRESAT